MAKFPKEIFVSREVDGKDNWLLASEKAEDANDGAVAIYVLKKVAKKSTKVVIED